MPCGNGRYPTPPLASPRLVLESRGQADAPHLDAGISRSNLRLWSPAVLRLLNQQKPVEEPSRVTSIDHLDIRLLREGLGGPIRAKGHARSAITGRYISRAAAGRHPRTFVVEVGEAMAERLRRGLHDLD